MTQTEIILYIMSYKGYTVASLQCGLNVLKGSKRIIRVKRTGNNDKDFQKLLELFNEHLINNNT